MIIEEVWRPGVIIFMLNHLFYFIYGRVDNYGIVFIVTWQTI